MQYIEPLARLISEFTKLPGVGEKTAVRYAYSMLTRPEEDVQNLASALLDVKKKVHFCSVCGNFTENDVCDICKTRSVGPDDINIKGLLSRLDGVKEVILATNPDVEGEATAMYIARLLKPLGIKVTRIARGLPEGSVIEYADEMTLSRALQSRIEL